jgi:hypothetical protein|tara:strand:- start:2265 stop:2483 length:219 start_codon:yes stop_codon:yes gene_type:complete
MGFLRPKITPPPPMPEPTPLPEAPDESDEDVIDAGEEQVKKTKKKKGRTSTILTSMMGDETEANINTKSLLG